MPNRKTHVAIGVSAGSVAAMFAALRNDQEITFGEYVAEVMGGAAGGFIGALAPDILDPPTSPFHRDLGHGAFQASIGAYQFSVHYAAVQEMLRVKADECWASFEREQALGNNGSALLWMLAWTALRSLAGFLVGFAAGYASHLIADSGSKMGLPLIAAGF